MQNNGGKKVWSETKLITTEGFGKTVLPCSIKLPLNSGGYLLLAKFESSDKKTLPVISRRYLKVGKQQDNYRFYDLKTE